MTVKTNNYQHNARLSLLACQIEIPAMTTSAERDAHLSLSAAKVSHALESTSVDLVVLPELSTIDYARETFAELGVLGETLNGPSFQVWRRVAQQYKTTIVYSFPRRSEQGMHISLAAVTPEGELQAYYDKLHLAQYGASMEKEYFVRGDHLMVFEVKGFRFAPIICYDIRIPELSRTLVIDHKVDMILHCGAYYRDESFHTWHPFATTRAIENQVYFLSLNRAGEYYGASLFCRPWMDKNTVPLHFLAHDECFQVIEVKRSEIEQARANYSFLRDRLTDYKLAVY